MRPAWVAGAGLWTPGFAGLAAWAAGARDEAAREPRCALLSVRLAGRASLLTRMAAEVLEQAAAGAALAELATVFVTAYGESQTLGALLGQLCADGVYSPARFSASVHNTAAGLCSIATGSRGFSTTLAAGFDGVAMGLLEAMALLEQRGGEAVVVFADEAPPPPFARAGLAPLATALRLCAERPARPLGRLARLRPSGLEPTPALHAVSFAPGVPASFATNPVAPSLPLLAALHGQRAGPCALSPGWRVELEASW